MNGNGKKRLHDGMEWEWKVSVFDGECPLDCIISNKEVEDEHAVQNWEDFPA